jgi:hypothetical protein
MEDTTMEKIKNDGAAGMSFHKVQRSAAIAAGTAGYMGHLPKREQVRRLTNYQAIMDLEATGHKGNDPKQSWVKLLIDNLGRGQL